MRDIGIWLALLLTLAACAASPDPDSLSYDPLEERQPRGARAEQAGRPRGLRAGGARLRRDGAAAGAPRHHQPPRQLAAARADRPVRAAGPRRRRGRSRRRASRSTPPSGSAACSTSPPRWGCPTTRPTSTRSSTAGACRRAAISELPLVGPGTQRDWTGYALDQALDPTYYVLPVAALDRAPRRSAALDIVNDRYELDTDDGDAALRVRRQLHRAADQLPAEHAGAAAGRHRRRAAGGCLCRSMTSTRRGALLGLAAARRGARGRRGRRAPTPRRRRARFVAEAGAAS